MEKLEESFQQGPFYTGKPMQIGNHLWRMVIGYNDRGREVVTRYEFLDKSTMFWSHQQAWPRYNINDPYLGLPKRLSELYARELPALRLFGLVPHPKPAEQFGLRV